MGLVLLLLDLSETLGELGFHCGENSRVAVFSLGLGVALHLLQLVDGGLELGAGFVEVTLGLVPLLLEESVAALPKRLLFVEQIYLVLKLPLHLGALLASAVKLSSDGLRVTCKSLLQLLVLLTGAAKLRFQVPLQLLLLAF